MHLENKNYGGKGMMKKILLGVLVVTLLLGVSVGVASATYTGMGRAEGSLSGHFWRTIYPQKTSLTIYNSVTLVKEVYKINLYYPNSEDEIWFGGFPDKVEPVSIRIKSLSAPNEVVVLEQSFNKNSKKLFICRLLNKSGCSKHRIELSYFVKGISWQVKYRLEVNKSEDVFNFSGRVIITNQSGNPVEYKNVKIKLVAGDVHQVGGRFYALGEDKAPASRFEERKFFEYHTYTLDKPTTLKWNETKLIPFFSKISTKLFQNSSTFQKKLIFEGQRSNKVQIRLSFLNSEDNGLGISLPAGVVQVFKQDTDEQLEFIGEDQIGHTPKDEMIELYIGNAFDIVGERTVTDRKQIDTRTWEESIKITFKNHKDEDITITAIERLRGDWKITDKSMWQQYYDYERDANVLELNNPNIGEYRKQDAQTMEFVIHIHKDGIGYIRYTVRYKR